MKTYDLTIVHENGKEVKKVVKERELFYQLGRRMSRESIIESLNRDGFIQIMSKSTKRAAEALIRVEPHKLSWSERVRSIARKAISYITLKG